MSNSQEKRNRDYTGIVIVAVLLPLYLVFAIAGKPDTGKYVCIGIGMHLIAVRINWDLRRYLWFWTTVGILLAIHIPLLLIVPWPSRWIPAISVLPFGALDCGIILGTIALMEKWLKKAPPPDEAQISGK